MNQLDISQPRRRIETIDPAATLMDALRRRVSGNEGGERVEISIIDGGVATAGLRALIGGWPELRVETASGGGGGELTADTIEAAQSQLESAAREAMRGAGFRARLEHAVRADAWLALTPFPNARARIVGLTEPRSVRAPCATCGGLGQVPVDTDDGDGGAAPCQGCGGEGWRRQVAQMDAVLASAVALDHLAGAPDGAEAMIRANLADLIARRALLPELVSLETDGAAPVAVLTTPLPVAHCRVAIGRRESRRVFEVWALGDPLELADPPPLLDLLHEYALDRLMLDPRADDGALADQLAATRIGRAALRAAAAFEPRFDADDIAFADATGATGEGAAAKTLSASKLVSRDLTDRLFRYAQKSYRSLGDRGRRLIWRLMVSAAPALALLLTGLGYVGAADGWLGALGEALPPTLRESLAIAAWAAPLALLWLAALWASVLHFRLRTRQVIGRTLGFGPTDALRQARRPWTALLLGGLLYALAFIGSAPPDQDRLGLAEETQLLGRFRIPILNSVFHGAADGRDWIAAALGVSQPPSRPNLDELQSGVVSRQSLLAERLRMVAFAARPEQWATFEGVAAVKALGPSGVAVLAVQCAQGRPILSLVLEPLAELSRVSLFVNRVSLPDAVARDRDGAMSWPATAGALSAVRQGVALRAVVEDLTPSGGVRLYDFTLADSSIHVANATRGCRG